MSDASQREWRFFPDDMIDFAGKMLAYTDGLNLTKGDRVGFQAPDGRILEGMVLRLIQSAGDVQWP